MTNIIIALIVKIKYIFLQFLASNFDKMRESVSKFTERQYSLPPSVSANVVVTPPNDNS